eukprot:3937817-Rhodomonas_salina.1
MLLSLLAFTLSLCPTALETSAEAKRSLFPNLVAALDGNNWCAILFALALLSMLSRRSMRGVLLTCLLSGTFDARCSLGMCVVCLAMFLARCAVLPLTWMALCRAQGCSHGRALQAHFWIVVGHACQDCQARVRAEDQRARRVGPPCPELSRWPRFQKPCSLLAVRGGDCLSEHRQFVFTSCRELSVRTRRICMQVVPYMSVKTHNLHTVCAMTVSQRHRHFAYTLHMIIIIIIIIIIIFWGEGD